MYLQIKLKALKIIRFYKFTSLVLTVFFFWAVPSANFAQELDVMSYNIRYASPNDGPNLWENRKGAMVETLSNINPDLLGLQEVLHTQLLELTNGLKEYSYIGVGREDGKTMGEYSPILYRKDTFEVLDSGTFWLSEEAKSLGLIDGISSESSFFKKKFGKKVKIKKIKQPKSLKQKLGLGIFSSSSEELITKAKEELMFNKYGL